MAEGLGEVTELLAVQADLLAHQAEVIRVAEHFFEDDRGLVEFADAGEAFHVPEGADGEGAFVAFQAVGGAVLEFVAEDEDVGAQLLLDGFEGAEPARLLAAHEAQQWHQQGTGVEGVTALVLDVGLQVLVPEVIEDVFVDRIAYFPPFAHRAGQAAVFGDLHGAVDGHPAAYGAVQETLFAATHLPDSMVGLLPVGDYEIDEFADGHPEIVGDAAPGLIVQVDGIDELPVDVHLLLVVGAVPDPDGLTAAVALQVLQLHFVQLGFAVDRVHQLQVIHAFVADPVHEVLGLFGVAQPQKGVHGEGRVPHPGEAVVPVALSADLFR